MSGLKRIIKCFPFREEDRDTLVIGLGARLNPQANHLELALVPGPFTGKYAVGTDAVVRTRITTLVGIKQWLSFQAMDTHIDDADGTRLTRIQYRLTDGVDEFYWDGAQWAISTVDWNDEEEVAANISAFPVDSRSLGVVINLTTTDEDSTPTLSWVKVLYSTDIESQEDIVFRSLIPLMKEKIRPCADLIVQMDGTDTIDLGSIEDLETPYDIVGVAAVYNHTADPYHLIDVLSSYDENTKIISLTPGSVPSGADAWVKFQYVPQITVQTGQDFVEVDRIPSIILEDINLLDSKEVAEKDHIVNKLTGDSVVVPGPIQGDLEITLTAITDKNTDQHRLADQIKRFFGNNPQLRSVGLDEDFRLWLIDEYDMRTSAGRAGLITGQATFRISGVLWYHEDSYDAKAVNKFTIRLYPEGLAVGEEAVTATSTVYWGDGVAGIYDAAFIQALPDSAPAFNRARKFSFTAGAGEYGFYALPQSFGTPRFFVGGFEGGWGQVATGVDIDGVLYDVWRTNQANLGLTYVEVR